MDPGDQQLLSVLAFQIPLFLLAVLLVQPFHLDPVRNGVTVSRQIHYCGNCSIPLLQGFQEVQLDHVGLQLPFENRFLSNMSM